ncbi:hypothetical protein V5799_006187 [Amblyomma americanum]|uniref:PDZ domain-containing protein n=1 Tax=Amblyomma americanum TaxID=6943 RepID=A0AAQ4DX41_AMBAM
MNSAANGHGQCESCCCCCCCYGEQQRSGTIPRHKGGIVGGNNAFCRQAQTSASTDKRRQSSRVWRWIKRRLFALAQGEDVAYRRRTEALEDVSLTLTKRLSFINEDKRGTSTVELVKREGSTLGLIISGGIDKGTRPKVESLRPGSIAHRCDALAIGDHIVAVNGIRTSKLKHDEIVNLLKNAGDKVVLDVEYEIPSTAAEMSMCVCPKVIQVKLEKENGSFGFLIRGGTCPEKLKCRPLTITHVRPGAPADREGTIKAGDRLLAVDNINLNNASLNEAMAVLKQVEKQALLTIEYDVSVMDAVRNASGPLLVEIDKTPGAQLGATLTQVPHGEGAIVFDSIKQASIAERCGALHVGDQLLAIDGTRVDQMTAAEAMQLLKMAVGDIIRLEILPISQMALRKCPSSQSKRSAAAAGQGYASSYDTLSSMGAHSNRSAATAQGRCPLPPLPPPPPQVPSTPSSSRRGKPSRKQLPEYLSSSSNASISSVYGVPPCLFGPSQLSHTETTQVIIYADHKGFGFALQGPTPYASDPLPPVPTISSIDPRGPAERTGVVQIGDRVLTVNGQSTEGLSVEEVTQLIQQSRPRVVLDIEFDVAESVIPSSGTFTVKLAKKGPGLGITITSPKNRRPGEPLLISDIKHGSVAHRTGTLQPGDHLLAIDSVRMDNCTIEDAAQILQASEEVVKLRIRKDEAFCEEPDATGAVIFTVELARHGGPLGITISGTEEPFDPIIISGLTEGGLAERTGALHVGDRILAINGQSLRGKPLSEAILLLQNSGDVVTLKISKSPRNQGLDAHRIERPKEVSPALRRSLVATPPVPCLATTEPRPTFQPEPSSFLNLYATPIPSVDSAVESWDSYGGLEAATAAAAANGAAPTLAKVVPSTPDIARRETDVPTTVAQPSSPKQSCSNVSAELKSWERDVWGHRPPPNLTAIPGPSASNPQTFIPTSSHSAASDSGSADWSKVLEDLETCGQSKLLRQIERSIMGSLPSIAPLPNPEMHLPNPENLQYDDLYGFQSRLQSDDTSTECEFQTADHEQAPFTLSPYEVQHDGHRHGDGSVTPYPNYGGRMTAPIPIEVHRVTLFKDKVYEDFGFSVSDGLYEKGVYVNRIRPGGPADMSGILKPFDRILQVNETKTHDFDCCLTVPLMASAGDSVELIVSRPAYVNGNSSHRNYEGSAFHPWIDDNDREDCSSPHGSRPGSQILTKTL